MDTRNERGGKPMTMVSVTSGTGERFAVVGERVNTAADLPNASRRECWLSHRAKPMRQVACVPRVATVVTTDLSWRSRQRSGDASCTAQTSHGPNDANSADTRLALRFQARLALKPASDPSNPSESTTFAHSLVPRQQDKALHAAKLT